MLDMHHPGDGDEEQVPRPAARGPGRADRRRRRQHLLPDDVRPGDPRDGLLVRGAAGADAVADRCTCSTATHDEPKIAQGNLIGKRLPEKKTPAQIIEELYIRCLSRTPKPDGDEEPARRWWTRKPDKKQALEDVFWALLNSREFMFNH